MEYEEEEEEEDTRDPNKKHFIEKPIISHSVYEGQNGHHYSIDESTSLKDYFRFQFNKDNYIIYEPKSDKIYLHIIKRSAAVGKGFGKIMLKDFCNYLINTIGNKDIYLTADPSIKEDGRSDLSDDNEKLFNYYKTLGFNQYSNVKTNDFKSTLSNIIDATSAKGGKKSKKMSNKIKKSNKIKMSNKKRKSNKKRRNYRK